MALKTHKDGRAPSKHNNMLIRLPGILFFPFTMLWSLLYGAIAGAIFKLLSVYENWILINRLNATLWKKYPQRSYHKYILSMWAVQIKGKPVELAEATKIQIEKAHPSEPFPFMRMLSNTIAMLIIAPFMALWGLVDGPIYVFKSALLERKKYITALANQKTIVAK